jgi:hypothetical protein
MRTASPLFFCQIEAVETVIHINEVLDSVREPRWAPAVSRETFNALCDGTLKKLESTAKGSFVARQVAPPQREDSKPLVTAARWQSVPAKGPGSRAARHPRGRQRPGEGGAE